MEPEASLSRTVEGEEELPSLKVPVAEGRAENSVVCTVSFPAADDDTT